MARRLIQAALEKLTSDELEQFKCILCDTRLSSLASITRGSLENADPADIADIIVSFSHDVYGVTGTAWLLQAINQKDAAEALRKAAEMHFVDRHEEDIIAWTTDVKSLLDTLKGPAQLTDDHIKTILEKKTSQNQMRELYKHVSGWDDAKKDKLEEALKDTNGHLFRDLGGQ